MGRPPFFQARWVDWGMPVWLNMDGLHELDNTQVMYTTSGSIDYQNEDTRGCISLSLSEKLTKGIYDVEIYNNGFMVGKGDFKLK